MRDSKINTKNIPATYDEMKSYISSYNEKYDKKLGIEDDKLVYFPKYVTNNEKKWLEDLNIAVSSNIPFDPVEWDKTATLEECFLWNDNNKGTQIIGLNTDKISGITTIRIPSRCTAIRSDYSFNGNENYKKFLSKIKSVEIPYTVKEIGEYAFLYFTQLEKINIPSSVIVIKDEAFEWCSNLKIIEIPDGVKSIGIQVFYGCSSLTNITIPDSATSIGDGAFHGCSSLEKINLPNDLEDLSSKIFYNCFNLNEVEIPNSVKNIGAFCFTNCSNLTNITYNGTQSQWNSINKDSNWNLHSVIETITCTDGVIYFKI